MPTRPLTLLAAILFAATLAARASDPIPGPVGGQSATVTQPHVTAELIPERTLVFSGKPFDVILHLHMDPGWHTYWINPGDAGLATTIKWSLPLGGISGPIQWPTPEIHAMGPLTTYGYDGDVYLLTKIALQARESDKVAEVTGYLHASWLVCKEECIPGNADFALKLHVAGRNAPLDYKFIDNRELFAAARARLPVPNTRWDVQAAYQRVGLADALVIHFKEKGSPAPLGHLEFFAEEANVLAPKNAVTSPPLPQNHPEFDLVYSLQQNGEKPDHLSGVLVSDQPLIGTAKAVYISSFSTHADVPPVPSASLRQPPTASSPGVAGVGPTPGSGDSEPAAATAVPLAPPNSPASHPELVEGSVQSSPFLLTVLGFAFLGGLILNLMPCVLPVLSLKVFSLIKHAGENSGTAWRQGVAFAAGVVVSFWILAGLLLVLRAAGNHLGWGFQMQSPGFVLALTFLFFLLGLNLFGVFELGTSLVGLDARASSHLGGLSSSFANGALATLAATPCTAPFMGSSVGFAAEQPPAISLLVFTFLALGMAAPYLALTTFPGALRFVPKPGPWMESLKQFMGFLLFGTVIFLVYVFGALVGREQVPTLLSALLLAGFAAWIFGRWSSPVRPPAVRFFSLLLSLALLFGAIEWGVAASRVKPESQGKTPVSSEDWQPYSADAVKKALAEGRPAFVDFTAAWCLSCKVNEQLALEVDSTKQAFAKKNVALFRGDWTHSDPEISKTLEEYHRDGVPLYLLYSPKTPDAPQVLPEVLTPGIVQDALQKM